MEPCQGVPGREDSALSLDPSLSSEGLYLEPPVLWMTDSDGLACSLTPELLLS